MSPAKKLTLSYFFLAATLALTAFLFLTKSTPPPTFVDPLNVLSPAAFTTITDTLLPGLMAASVVGLMFSCIASSGFSARLSRLDVVNLLSAMLFSLTAITYTQQSTYNTHAQKHFNERQANLRTILNTTLDVEDIRGNTVTIRTPAVLLKEGKVLGQPYAVYETPTRLTLTLDEAFRLESYLKKANHAGADFMSNQHTALASLSK